MAAKEVKVKAKISGLLERINKTYGDVLISGDDLSEIQGGIIPTTLSLDIALSGGLAEGTVTVISSPPKAGKTTLCLQIIAQAQKHFKKKCYYIDVESRLRTELLSTINGLVYTEEGSVSSGIPKLMIIKSSESKFLTAEDILNIIWDIVVNEPNSLIILDSIAALCTQESFTGSLGDSKRMAAIPSLMYEFLRKTAQVLPVKKSNLIAITHLQASPKAYTGPVTVGGNAIQFFSSNILRCTSSEEIEQDGEKIGKNSEFKVFSSALGPPSKISTIYVRYGHGCDNIEDLVNTGETYGFISKGGSWYQYKEQKFHGQEGLKQFFKDNAEEAKELEREIRDLLLTKT